MAKTKQQITNNHKLTDFYTRASAASSSQPPSSQPSGSQPRLSVPSHSPNRKPNASGSTSTSSKRTLPLSQSLSRARVKVSMYPSPSSGGQTPHTKTNASNTRVKSTALTPTQSLVRPQNTGKAYPHASPLRPVKKENAPPAGFKRDPEVISISSGSDAATHISISSGSPAARSIISISSSTNPPSVISIHSSIPDVRGAVIERGRHLGTSTTHAVPRRRSPRLMETTAASALKPAVKREASRDAVLTGILTSPVKLENLAMKKRKRAIASDDEEVVDLTGVEEVIYAVSKPRVMVEPASSSKPPTPSGSSTKPNTPSSRKERLSANFKGGDSAIHFDQDEDEEVIPSSQSDENELSLSRRPLRKNMHEVKESVQAWVSNSQPLVSSTDTAGAGNGWDLSTSADADVEDQSFNDFGGMNLSFDAQMDVDVPFGESPQRPRSLTPTTDRRSLGVIGDKVKLDNTQTPTRRPSSSPLKPRVPSAQSANPSSPFAPIPPSSPPGTPPPHSSPTRRRPESASPSAPRIASIRTTFESSDPSPTLISSASSLTKIDLASQRPSPKASATPSKTKTIATPGSSPTKRLKVEVVIPIYPRTPRTMDQKSKTASIIDKIRAQAFASRSSPEDESFGELDKPSDSDSDLDMGEEGLFAELTKGKQPVKPARNSTASASLSDALSSPLTDIDEVSPRRKRRNMRRITSPTPSSSTMVSSRPSRPSRPSRTSGIPPGRLPTTITSAASGSSGVKKRKKPNDPFAALMKEKAADAKLAPARARSGLLSGNFNFDAYDSDKESPADVASGSGSKGKGKRSIASRSSDDGNIENIVGEEDRRRLLGEDEDGAIGRILETDLQEKGKGERKPIVLGVPLWRSDVDTGASTDVDGSGYVLPNLGDVGDHPVLNLLEKYAAENDKPGVTVLLQSGALGTSGFPLTNELLTWLFELAASTDEGVARHAYRSLRHICDAESSRKDSIGDYIVDFASVPKALAKLGARKDVIEALWWIDIPDVGTPGVDAASRRAVIWRLVELLGAFANCMMLDFSAVPYCVSILLAIGMDVGTDFDTKRSVVHAIEVICNTYCGEIASERESLEMDICSKVLLFAKSLDSVNKAYLMSFFPGGTPLVKRIGQWIAFALLTDDYGVQLASESSDGPPPLDNVIALLDPGSSDELNSDIFDLRRSTETSDEFDYVALGHHVDVLAHVLANISVYVKLEKQEKQMLDAERSSGSFSSAGSAETDTPEGSASLSKKRAPPKTKLENVKHLLERLGSKIVDTRAAHLDRSRTKAAIQRLAMRVHYQRLAALNPHSEGGKPRTMKLDAFFSKQPVT